MQAAESRRGRTSSADMRTPSGEVPSIEVGIGESNGLFITMRGYLGYTSLVTQNSMFRTFLNNF